MNDHFLSDAHRREYAYREDIGYLCGSCRDNPRIYGCWLCADCLHDHHTWQQQEQERNTQNIISTHEDKK